MASNGMTKPICRGCANHIDQGSIVQFGNGMWHLTCFNCVKCHNNIEPDSNLLLLSDGSPLCSSCSQHCSVCNLPISDEAVMTADQCYHASCFKCTKCNNKIEGSLFARTSSGIYCMSCYAERREAQKKRGHAPNASRAINSAKEKSLPSIPVEALFDVGSENERSSSVDSEPKPVKSNSASAYSPHHQHAPSIGISQKTSIPRNLSENFTDVKRMPTLSRKSTKESVPTSPSGLSNQMEPSSPHSYMEGLKSEIKSLQRQLADSEFGYSKLKLHNDQVTERIKVFQEEFSNEINRRKAAEAALQQLESEHRTHSMTIDDLYTKIAELNSEKNQLQAEIFDLKEQKDSLNQEIAAKIEVQKLISEPITASDLQHSPELIESRFVPDSQYDVSDEPTPESPTFPLGKNKSLSNLEEITSESRVVSPIHQRFNSGSGLRTSISSDGSAKTRLKSVRRSLDVRPSEEGHTMVNPGKRTSMNDIAVESSSLPVPKPASTPGSPNSQASSLNSQSQEGSPSDRESKNSNSRRFNWKNAFKIAPRPAQSYSDNSALKAQISSPKGPSPISDINKGLISGPVSNPAVTSSPSSESKTSSSIPSMFASLDAPLGDQHNFVPHPYLRPVRCDHCKEKMWGLQSKELRCSACGFHCHYKCSPNVAYDCPGVGHEYPRIVDNPIGSRPLSPSLPPSNSAQTLVENGDPSQMPPLEDTTTSPNVIFGVELKRQLELEDSGKLVPRIVEQCVHAVEQKAMTMEGIYRKSGPHSVMKSLRSQLVASGGGEQIDLIDADEFRDITAVTSVLKQYFRELPIPLFTFESYDAWIQATAVSEEPDRAQAYAQVLLSLPEEYRETLVFFVDHLHKIFLQQKHNLMSSKNIGVVFGPTLMRCQNDQQDFDDMAKKNTTVDLLVQSWTSIKETLSNPPSST